MSGYHHGSYDDGCPDCGTTDTVHTDGCRRRVVRHRNRSHIATGAGPGEPRRAPGDPCNVCDGPCRFGNCADCGGHSEHNWGCRQTATGATR